MKKTLLLISLLALMFTGCQNAADTTKEDSELDSTTTNTDTSSELEVYDVVCTPLDEGIRFTWKEPENIKDTYFYVYITYEGRTCLTRTGRCTYSILPLENNKEYTFTIKFADITETIFSKGVTVKATPSPEQPEQKPVSGSTEPIKTNLEEFIVGKWKKTSTDTGYYVLSTTLEFYSNHTGKAYFNDPNNYNSFEWHISNKTITLTGYVKYSGPVANKDGNLFFDTTTIPGYIISKSTYKRIN